MRSAMFRMIGSNEFAELKERIQAFGFAAIPDALLQDQFAELQQEAISYFDRAFYAEAHEKLDYRAHIADFGPVADAYVRSCELGALLEAVFGRAYTICPEKSCYTYFVDDGYLAPHLDDIPGTNPVSVITYLWAETASSDKRDLQLHIHSDGNLPSSAPTISLETAEATIVCGFGTRFWHGRTVPSVERKVIAVTGSFSDI